MNAPKLRDPFDLADELVRMVQEMDREAVIDDGQETDLTPLDEDETVTDYRNRRGE